MLAAIAQSTLIRLIPVGMVLIALQRTIFLEFKIAGVIVQVVLAFAAACGAVGGSERGAVAGFVLGLMFDLVEGTPLGSTAIAWTLAGVTAGLLALIVAEPQWWLASLFVGLGAVVGEAALPAVRLFVGDDDPWPANLATILTVVGVTSTLLAPLLLPIARWCLKLRGSAWSAPADEAAV